MTSSDPSRAGYAYALSAFALWGLIPLFFKALIPVDSLDIVAHRILWAIPPLALLLWARGRLDELARALRNPRVRATLLLTAALIAVNWLVYILGVNSGHVLATSLGYYLNPLINVLIGRFLLHEQLGRLQWGALGLAAIGIAILAAGASFTDLWITLTLAFSFGFYGYFRKQVDVGAAPGLLLETIILAPLTILWLWGLRDPGEPLWGPSDWHMALLLVSGAVTAVPLLLFTEGARRLPYSTLGILQFLAPTMQFLMGVFLFGELFTTARALAFACIWSAIGLYVVALVQERRRRRQPS
ncbi:EamA family transporter RarD [Sphingomicrobium astaxanthinifaciens]|uniref:EamA family transporter RarD n=1 Tax=Sphingomicrobium astaxanthinifaciens TaxID=1227949 RepID=UPI001FCBEBBD|nr:EamA family transporter RarD [Sphingomicrobium astaxanthinifaciens]MCJ7420851.1 EamA family transporter RarD [Sphingomicrobium astaxanthinifaciens]